MASDTYLFIDGEYLRQIHREVMRDFFGVDGELDIGETMRSARAIRAFFYDSIDDVPRGDETPEACKARIAPLEQFFARTSDLSGVHVRLGTVAGKRRRQKEVDILLATDMLTHGFNGNMRNAVLLSGDLDFRPIVEALVRQGVFVEVWYHRSSIARELPGAADFGREIRFRQLYSWNVETFQRAYRIPHEEHRAGDRWGQIVKAGSAAGCEVELYKVATQSGEPRFSLWINTGQWDSIVLSDQDSDLIERYVGVQYAPIQWEFGADEIRIAKGSGA